MTKAIATALSGVSLVAPTPFTESEEIAYEDIGRIVDWAIAKGVRSLAVTGTMGEAFRLSDAERRSVVSEFCRCARGRVPVVAGVGHLSAVTVIDLARDLVRLGATYLLVPPPPIGAVTTETVEAFYDSVALAVDVPLIMQDDPVNLGFALAPETVSRLAARHPNIAYVKLEDLPSPPKIRRVRELTRDGVQCLGGSAGVYALEELLAGAAGIMTGFSFPEALVACADAYQAGRASEARRFMEVGASLARVESMPRISLSLRKHMYWKRSVLSTPVVRSPGIAADPWIVGLALDELRRLEGAWIELVGDS